MATVLTPSTELDEKQEFVSIADFRQHLSEMLNQAYYLKQTYIITQHKKPVVAMIPLFDEAMVDRLDLFLANEAVRVSLEKEKAGQKSLTQEEMEVELGMK